MATVTDSLVFRDIFSTEEASRIWSDDKRTEKYLEFEAALANVQGRLGVIPTRAADAIKNMCRLELIDMQELAVQTRQIGYPVLPLVRQLVSLVNGAEPGLGEWAHWGATTQVKPIVLLPPSQDSRNTH